MKTVRRVLFGVVLGILFAAVVPISRPNGHDERPRALTR